MNIEITSRHFTASAHLKELIHDKINKVKKFNSNIMSCQVILTKENKNENVEIIVRAKGHDFAAHETSDIFERSLVNALDKISIQIKKRHEKALGR